MKTVICVDTLLVFNPVDVLSLEQITKFGKKGVEVPEELYHEYLAASSKFFEINSQLEELYRAQRGLPNQAVNPVVIDLQPKEDRHA